MMAVSHLSRASRSRSPISPLLLLLAVITTLFALASCTALAQTSPESPVDSESEPHSEYAHHQVLRVFANPSTSEPLASFIANNHIDLWSDVAPLRSGHIDLRVTRAQAAQLTSGVLPPGTRTQVLVADVAKLISKVADDQHQLVSLSDSDKDAKVDANAPAHQRLMAQFRIDSSFLTFKQVGEYLNELQTAYPKLVSTSVIGKTYEERDLVAVRVGRLDKPAAPGKKRFGVMVLGGAHAREWSSVSSTLMTIHSLVAEAVSGSARAVAVLDAFEFHFVPMANPDGYEYSMNKDRLWRKNRQPIGHASCLGIDINRNWPFRWSSATRNNANGNSTTTTSGTNAAQCDPTFPGTGPADAKETQALMSWIQSLRSSPSLQLTAMYDVHAYSQLWMYPHAFSCSTNLPNGDALQRVSSKAAAAIKQVAGAQFTTGQICSTIYVAAGSMSDWAYETLALPFAFAIELSPGNSDPSGFLLPADKIANVGREMVAGFLASVQEIGSMLGGDDWVKVTAAANAAEKGLEGGVSGVQKKEASSAMRPGGSMVIVALVAAAMTVLAMVSM
ncbi:hypothetical protein BCR44DRAFT_44618 [Catenaria anguillulae PL171]|uniref:Peptidase M14 domain-containing protein n=1 Tax=Catenaria anguillulae PL171 TaxID=765915 RepID=A0A1Y2HU66_9FUNG|nr:hypothetical protein BCR44DRAFT_44618 [Catenaria anguillulae PL171]